MSPVDWQQARSIFERALEKDTEKRAELLARSCGDDDELRARVEALLDADARGEGVLESPALSGDVDLLGEIVGERMAGRRIGAYTITGTIGVGGMGTVFEAEQENPRRTVALKVVRFGLATAEASRRARFEAEVLARLRHPGIAQIYEAGTYREEGGPLLPFFAMEHVEGARTLIEYAEVERLDRDARLELFATVCAAVQHGHEKGVIHRDLKPGNLLVDRSGRVKVIDFGLARAADPALVSESLRTETGHVAGTLAYMAPEQLDADPGHVDTRADLYSLGAVLYELLCGRPPIDLGGVPLLEAARRVKEAQPARPGALRPDLPRELDWILGRALEKDPSRRYASAAELAEDLRRFRAREPIAAGPPSQTYRLALFVRRHRVAVAGALFVFLALLLGVAGTSVGLVRAKDAQHQAEEETTRALEAEKAAEEASARAREEADKYREVATFTRDLFRVSDPRFGAGAEINARDLLDRGAARVESELRGRPELRGTMAWTLGDAYAGLGELERAMPLLQGSLELLRQSHEGDHLDVAGCLDSLGVASYDLDRLAEAEAAHLEALEIRRRLVGEESEAFAASLNNVAIVLQRTGRGEEAETMYRRSIAIREKQHGEHDVSLISPLENLGLLLSDRGEYAAAIEALERAAELGDREHEHPHPDLASSLHNLGVVYWTTGALEPAKERFEQSLAVARELYRSDHPLLASILGDLGQVTSDLGDTAKAALMIEESLAMNRRLFGDVHTAVALNLNNLAAAYRKLEELDRAEPAYRESIAIYRSITGEDSTSVALGLNNLASLLREKGEYEEATELFAQALELNRRINGDVHLNTAGTRLNLGRLLRYQERFEAAREQLDEALAVVRELFGPGSTYEGIILDDLGLTLAGQGELEAAEARYHEALTIHRTQVGEAHPRTVQTIIHLARAHVTAERWDDAEATLSEQVKRLEALGAGDEAAGVQDLRQALVDLRQLRGER